MSDPPQPGEVCLKCWGFPARTKFPAVLNFNRNGGNLVKKIEKKKGGQYPEAVSEAVSGCTAAWAGRSLFVAAEVLADAAVSAGASRPLNKVETV